jgi:DNA-binding MarR family transcriptional regulator
MANKPDQLDPYLEIALDKFWETVPSVWGNIRAHIRSLATEKYEISVEQFHILRCVRKGHCTISELAEVRNLSRPAISQGVDALVSRGLLVRTQNDVDRRYVDIALTANGSQMLEEIFHSTREWMKQGLEVLSKDELENLSAGLEILKKFNQETK